MQANGAGDNVTRSVAPVGVTVYSNAFESFFKHDDDIVGALAYCFYKQQKREFIMLNKIDATHERVREYHFDLNDKRIAQLRENAEHRVNNYAQNVAEATAEELESEVVEGVLIDEFSKHGKRIEELFEAVKKGNAEVLKNVETTNEELFEAVKKGNAEVLKNVETTNQSVVNGTKWWKSVLASVAASFVFGLVLTWAKVINWTNPLASEPSPRTTSEIRQ